MGKHKFYNNIAFYSMRKMDTHKKTHKNKQKQKIKNYNKKNLTNLTIPLTCQTNFLYVMEGISMKIHEFKSDNNHPPNPNIMAYAAKKSNILESQNP